VDKSLKEVLRSFKGEEVIQSKLCTVINVDGFVCDCEPIDGSADFLDVRLNAGLTDGVLITPKVGSIVMVTRYQTFEAFISLVTEVAKIEITCDNVIYNNGDNGGMVLVKELVKKINALEELTNTLLNTLKTTTIPLAPSGTYPFAPLYATVDPIAPITLESDLANDKILQ
jgi:hypothetical protein